MSSSSTSQRNNVLRLSATGWWTELEAQVPTALAELLRGLLSITTKRTIAPNAPHALIQLARKHVRDGIRVGEQEYDLLVCVSPTNAHQSYFVLVPTAHDSILRRLEEFKENE